MNNRTVVFAVMSLMTGMLLPGCAKTTEQKLDSAKESVGEARQELQDTRTAYAAEWQTFKHESEQTITANETKIDAFKDRMDHSGTKIKAKYTKDIAALEQSNRNLKQKLDNYKDEGQTKWEEFKTNFNHDMDAVGKTMTDLFNDVS